MSTNEPNIPKVDSWVTKLMKFHKENKDEFNANYVRELKTEKPQREYQYQITVLKIVAKISTYLMFGRFLDYCIKMGIKILIPGFME
jgi:hypothetical protein